MGLKRLSIFLFLLLSLLLSSAKLNDTIPASFLAHESLEPLEPHDPPMKRPDIMELKMRLKQLGLYQGPLDDVYESTAWEAVKEFQRKFWLDPNGIIDNTTWDALGYGVPRILYAAEEGPMPEGEVRLEVDTEKLILTVFVGDTAWKSYPVAVGKWTTLSPVGEWKIVEMGYAPGGPFGSRWMALDVPWGSYGIHGTNRPWSVGSYASSGCIRLYNEDVEEIFDLCEMGTRVRIIGVRPSLNFSAPLREGNISEEVVMLQEVLREMGFDPGPLDGRYGGKTKQCVAELSFVYGLPGKGKADRDVFTLLGLE